MKKSSRLYQLRGLFSEDMDSKKKKLMLNSNEINSTLLMTQQLMEAAVLQSHAQMGAHGLYTTTQMPSAQPTAPTYILNPFIANNPAAHIMPFDGYLQTNPSLFCAGTQQTAPNNPFQFISASMNGHYNNAPTRADRLEVCQQYLRGACPNDDSKCHLAHPPLSCPIDRSNGQVTVCVDYVKQKCHREVCKYFHPPDHLVEQLRSGNGPANVPATSASAVAAATAAALIQARRYMPSLALSNHLPYMQPGMAINPYLLSALSAAERNAQYVQHSQMMMPQNFTREEEDMEQQRPGEMDDQSLENSISANESGGSNGSSSGKKRNYNESNRDNCVNDGSIVTSTPNSHCTPPKRPVIEPVLFDNSRKMATNAAPKNNTAAASYSTTMLPTGIPIGVNGVCGGGGGGAFAAAGQNIQSYPILQNLQLPYQHGAIGYQPVVSSAQTPFMQPQLVNLPYGSPPHARIAPP